MTNAEIFQKVAARELTPEEGSQKLQEADAVARLALRPRWLPHRAWVILVGVFAVLLAACGLQRD